MATSVLPAVQSAWPRAQVGFWVKQYTAGLLEGHPGVARVHAADPFWDTSPGHSKGGMGRFFAAWKEVRAQKYDAALVLNAEWRRAFAVALAGVPRRAGLSRRNSGFFLTDKTAPPSAGHFVDDHRAALSLLAPEILRDLFVPSVRVSGPEKKGAADWRARLGWTGSQMIALHPFTGDARKTWPWEKWRDFVLAVLKENPAWKFLLLAGKGEAGEARRLRAQTSPEAVEILVDAPLSHVKAVLSGALAFVGGDSGPGHAASALGVPVLSLFGPSRPDRCRALGPGPVRVLRHEPLADLPVPQVLHTFQELIYAARA